MTFTLSITLLHMWILSNDTPLSHYSDRAFDNDRLSTITFLEGMPESLQVGGVGGIVPEVNSLKSPVCANFQKVQHCDNIYNDSSNRCPCKSPKMLSVETILTSPIFFPRFGLVGRRYDNPKNGILSYNYCLGRGAWMLACAFFQNLTLAIFDRIKYSSFRSAPSPANPASR